MSLRNRFRSALGAFLRLQRGLRSVVAVTSVLMAFVSAWETGISALAQGPVVGRKVPLERPDGIPAIASPTDGVLDRILQPEGSSPGVAPGPGLGLGEPVLQPEPDWGMMGMGADLGMGCPPRWYAIGELMYLQRRGQRSVRVSNLDLGEFDYKPFVRATIGYTADCLDGWELSYLGGGQWDTDALALGQNLFSFVNAGAGVNPDDLITFQNADAHFYLLRSRYQSVEANRRWWGWDVFSTKLGLRYIQLDERYLFASQRTLAPAGTGVITTDISNHLIGPQAGMDLLRPHGRLTIGAKLNGGLFLNANDGSLFVQNAGTVVVNNGSGDEDFAWMVEAGVYAIYRLTGCLSVHLGYESTYIDGLVLTGRQFPQPISVLSGTRWNSEGDTVVHGGSLGLELVW